MIKHFHSSAKGARTVEMPKHLKMFQREWNTQLTTSIPLSTKSCGHAMSTGCLFRMVSGWFGGSRNVSPTHFNCRFRKKPNHCDTDRTCLMTYKESLRSDDSFANMIVGVIITYQTLTWYEPVEDNILLIIIV